MINTVTESAIPNRDEELLADLIRQLSHVANVESAIEEFCKRYPHLEAEARLYPKMQDILQGVQPKETSHPKQLGDFRIIRQMTRGGMGVIYEAIQERLKRRVVLKTMKATWDVGPARQRFNREQEVLARLHQTHIVPIHTADEKDGLQYFVMPFIEGASLNHVVEEARYQETSQSKGATTSLPAIAAAWLKKSSNHVSREGMSPAEPSIQRLQDDNFPSSYNSNKTTTSASSLQTSKEPQSPRELPMQYFRSVAQAMADVAEGLHYAHQEGLLHRDLKPSNIMIEPNGKCWIIDFGLAGFLDQTETVSSIAPQSGETESLTHGHTIGTPAYMAPEQWKHASKLNVRTDVWGLGVTLYEMLTLHRPFSVNESTHSSSQKQELQRLIAHARPQPLANYVKNVPVDLAAICMKALEKEPNQRYSTAQAFAEDLLKWLHDEPVSARPARMLRSMWLWAKRNRGWAATLMAVVLAIILVPSSYAYMQRQRSAELERETYTQRLMHLRSVNHQVGWSEDAKVMARAGAKIGKTQKLADEYVATFDYLDATLTKRYEGFEASGVAFDARGERLLIGGGKGVQARLWNAKTGDTVHSKLDGSGPVAFGSNGTPLQLVVKPDNPLCIILWDIDKQQSIREFELPARRDARITAIFLSSDGSLAAAAAEYPQSKGTVLVWDATTGKTVLATEQVATALALSPDSKYLAVGMTDGFAVWSLASGKQSVIQRSTNGVRSVAFGRNPFRSRHPWRLAVGDAGSLITVWDLDKNQAISICRGSRFEVNALVFSPDGVMLATAGRLNAKLWDVATGKLLLDLARRNAMHAVTFSPDGKQLAISSVPMWKKEAETDKGGVDVWELQSNREIQSLHGLAGSISSVHYSPDDRFIAALSHDWKLGVWDVNSGQLRCILEMPKGFTVDNFGVAFNKDASQLACCTGRTARLYDTNSGLVLQQWYVPPGLNDHLAFHPSGKLLLFRNENAEQEQYPVPSNTKYNVCRIRDLLGQEPTKSIAEIRGFISGITWCSSSHDGNYFVVSGISAGQVAAQGVIKVIDGVTGKELWQLPFDDAKTDGRTSIDSSGSIVSCRTNKPGEAVILELATGKVLGTWSETEARCEFPSQKYWRDSMTGYLFQKDNRTPLVNFDIVAETRADWFFSHAQTHVAWSSSEGTVSVANISAVQKRLAAVGLGW